MPERDAHRTTRFMKKFKLDWLHPAAHRRRVVVAGHSGQISSATVGEGICPSPREDLGRRASDYILKPFAKRGEMDQGILRFTWYSLVLVAKGYALALIIGTPIGFFLGLSKTFTKMFDPIIQVLRPVSPLAWLPLGLVLFLGAGKKRVANSARSSPSRSAAMWPTVLNTAVGVRADAAGLSERRQGAEALALEDALQGADSRRRCPTCSPASG